MAPRTTSHTPARPAKRSDRSRSGAFPWPGSSVRGPASRRCRRPIRSGRYSRPDLQILRPDWGMNTSTSGRRSAPPSTRTAPARSDRSARGRPPMPDRRSWSHTPASAPKRSPCPPPPDGCRPSRTTSCKDSHRCRRSHAASATPGPTATRR